MGPWLIYASLINRASMALYYGAPTGRAFCEFVQDAQVSVRCLDLLSDPFCGVCLIGDLPGQGKAVDREHHVDHKDDQGDVALVAQQHELDKAEVPRREEAEQR